MTSRLRRALCLLLSGAALRTAQAQAMPQAGQAAPDFTLPDQQGRPRRLDEWRGAWLALYFYPKDDTPGCTEQACTLRDEWLQLQALGAQVVGVSVDSSASHAAFAQKYKLPFPLLADEKGEVAARYGVLSNWGVIRFARRRTFLIDPQGRVARVYTEVDTARHAAELLADLRRLRQQAGR